MPEGTSSGWSRRAEQGPVAVVTAGNPPAGRGAAHRVLAWPWRHALIVLLGLLWLADAALQYQPFMFTTAFPHDVIAPTAAGNPLWVRGPVDFAATLMSHHIVVLNALFATLQLLIAIGLFVPALVRAALAVSMVWALMVWWMGNGVAGLLVGSVSPLAGLPGAVLLYALVAVLVWPRRARAASVAAASVLGRTGSALLWLGLWALFAVEAVLPSQRSTSGLHDQVTALATGEPRWIKDIDDHAASLLDGRGTTVSIVLAVCFALVAVSVLVPRLRRAGIVLAVVLALLIWVVGENFGGIATGQATDVNSGLPLALFALCFWPVSSGRAAQGHPTVAR